MRKIQEIKNIARHQLTEKYKLIIWPFAVSTVLNVSPFSFSLSLSMFYPSLSLSLYRCSILLSRSTSLSKSISVTPEIPALTGCPRLSLFPSSSLFSLAALSLSLSLSSLLYSTIYTEVPLGRVRKFSVDQHREEPRNEVL